MTQTISAAPHAAPGVLPARLVVLVESGTPRDAVAGFLEPLGVCAVRFEGGSEPARATATSLARGSDVSSWDPAGGLPTAATTGNVFVGSPLAFAPVLDALLGGAPRAADASGVHVLQHDDAGWRLAQFGVAPARPIAPLGRGVDRRLVLVRHGECDNFSGDGRVYSGTDLPLTARGRRQARALAGLLDELDTQPVYASPSARVLETAGLLAGDRPVVPRPELKEVSLGSLEGALVPELFAATPEFFIDPGAALPGGESFLDVAGRAGAALDAILRASDERDVVLVAHGGVNRSLLFRTLGADPRRFLTTRQDWAGVSTLEHSGAWTARTINWTTDGLAEIAVGRGGAPLAPGGTHR